MGDNPEVVTRSLEDLLHNPKRRRRRCDVDKETHEATKVFWYNVVYFQRYLNNKIRIQIFWNGIQDCVFVVADGAGELAKRQKRSRCSSA